MPVIQFPLYVTGFDINSIPAEDWNTDRLTSQVGHKIWNQYVEGKGWEKIVERNERLKQISAAAATPETTTTSSP